MGKKTEELKKKKNKKKYIVSGILGVLCIGFIIWIIVLNSGNNLNYETRKENNKTLYVIDETSYVESEEETDLVKIDVPKYGIIIAELYPDVAPITVKNFKKLISEKFYDNLTFHRVIKDFMIQTGDPTATGSGGSVESIKGEFSINGVENAISHKRGVLSMARAGANPETEQTLNSASSQFFIVHKDSEFLDGKYAAFGRVIKGIDVVDSVANVLTDKETDKPLVDQIMKSIRFVKVYEGE